MRNTIALQDIYLETEQVLKYKRILLICSAAIFPFYLSMFRYHIFGATLRISDFICAFVIFTSLLLFPKYFLKFMQLRFVPMWLIVAYILVQGIFLNNIDASIKEAIQLLWVCCYLGVASIYAEWDSKAFYKWTIIFLAISAFYTVLYHFALGHFTRYKLASDGKYAFGLLSVLLLLALSKYKDKKYTIFFVISLIPLVLSLERKGILGVLLILIIVAFAKFCRERPQLKGIPIILGIIALLFIPYLIDNFNTFIDEKIYDSYFLDESLAYYTSNIHRESLLINSYQIINDHPFFGIGADNIREYMSLFYFDRRLDNGAHNYYVDTLVKYGWVGTLLFLVWPLILTYYHKVTKRLSLELILFHCYCLFVITFMADGQAVLLMFLFSFLNPYLLADHD